LFILGFESNPYKEAPSALTYYLGSVGGLFADFGIGIFMNLDPNFVACIDDYFMTGAYNEKTVN
jgi:hypothetical protein